MRRRFFLLAVCLFLASMLILLSSCQKLATTAVVTQPDQYPAHAASMNTGDADGDLQPAYVYEYDGEKHLKADLLPNPAIVTFHPRFMNGENDYGQLLNLHDTGVSGFIEIDIATVFRDAEWTTRVWKFLKARVKVTVRDIDAEYADSLAPVYKEWEEDRFYIILNEVETYTLPAYNGGEALIEEYLDCYIFTFDKNPGDLTQNETPQILLTFRLL